MIDDKLPRYFFNGEYYYKVADVGSNILKLESQCEKRAELNSIRKFLTPEKTIYNNLATVCFFPDGTKVKVEVTEGEQYSREVGLAMTIMKKIFGRTGKFLEICKKVIIQN
jgi:hypothetical protein